MQRADYEVDYNRQLRKIASQLAEDDPDYDISWFLRRELGFWSTKEQALDVPKKTLKHGHVYHARIISIDRFACEVGD